MADSISNSEDLIDSRDVIARIEELTSDRDGYVLGAPDGSETEAPELWAENEADDAEELAALEALAAEAEGYAPDWEHGATLIRESYFVAYCEEMLKDCGDIPKDVPWYIAIDWETTAENIKVDYTEVDFDGVAYFIR